jgi:hypothetical protein
VSVTVSDAERFAGRRRLPGSASLNRQHNAPRAVASQLTAMGAFSRNIAAKAAWPGRQTFGLNDRCCISTLASMFSNFDRIVVELICHFSVRIRSGAPRLSGDKHQPAGFRQALGRIPGQEVENGSEKKTRLAGQCPNTWRTFRSLVCSLPLFLIYERSALNNAQADQLEEVNDIAERLSRRLAAALTRKSVAASGIAQTVSLLPSISQEQFSTITSRIIGGDPSVVVTSLISDWHITHVHPLVGNESTIGSDLRGSAARVEAINRVFDREHGVVQGPVRLLAGDDGFIVRQPVLQRQPNGDFAAVEDDATVPALVSHGLCGRALLLRGGGRRSPVRVRHRHSKQSGT